MSDIDWSKAPESCTHAGRTNNGNICYYKLDADGYDYMYIDEESQGWKRNASPRPLHRPLFARPAQWRGPQDGLPPVGERCTVHSDNPHEVYKNNVGREVEILAHAIDFDGSRVAVYRVADKYPSVYHALVSECFRPIQSERDKDIAWLESEIGRFLYVKDDGAMIAPALAEHLFNAGCRKTC